MMEIESKTGIRYFVLITCKRASTAGTGEASTYHALSIQRRNLERIAFITIRRTRKPRRILAYWYRPRCMVRFSSKC